MSVLSVYRRTGGGYVLSPARMAATPSQDHDGALVGVVESETFGALLDAHVARQLTYASRAFVSAELFDDARRAPGRLHDRR